MEKNLVLRQIKTFFIVITILTTIVFVWMFSDRDNVKNSGMIMMYVPGISAIIASFISKDKIRTYGWKPGKFRYLGYAYILPLIVAIIAFGLVWLSGLSEFTPDEVKNYRWAKYLGFDLPAPFLAGFLGKAILYTLMISLLTFGEELGWTGFLTPKLMKVTSVLKTSIIVGVFWSLWHFPAIIGGIYSWDTPLWVALPSFMISFIAISLIRSVLVIKSKSLWTGVILHASHNIILMSMFWEMTVKSEYTSYLVSETGVVIAIIYIVVAVLFWKFSLKKDQPLIIS